MRAGQSEDPVAKPTIFFRMICGSFVLLAVLVNLCGSKTRAQVLTEDSSLVVLQSLEPRAVPDCGAQQLDAKNEILKTFHIVVLAVPRHDENSLQSVLKCFGPGWERVPFRAKDGVIQIPTGEIFVKFKDGASQEAIQRTFEDNGLLVVREPRAQRSAYKATSQSASAARSLEAVRLLGKSPVVEYAEPNWIIVRTKNP